VPPATGGSLLAVPGLLSIEERGDVAVVTLERPEKRNALSIALRVELADAFERLGADDSVGCVMLTGAGSAFCAGMDVAQFGGDLSNRRQLVETSTGAFQAVGRCPRPVVAAVNGPALAGGFALALLCDVRIAAESATFGYPELPIGIPPSYAAVRATISPAAARELCLTGRVIDAGEALRLGVVTEVCSDLELPERALALAQRIAEMPSAAQNETKRRILRDGERAFGELFAEEERVFREALLEGEPDPAA
jgi:enoyl-CoA hydratase/carnithine racemase